MTVKDIDFGDLNWDREPYNSRAQYQATKLMNIMFTYKLHAKYGADGVEACCLNPGLGK
jgi:NAD(P)-dependent dehydrogenase (short-subunit alcohol dehydrogenase family)